MAIRTLVLGAAGFIGRRLVDRLSARGDHLTLVDRYSFDHPAAIAGDITDPAFVDRLTEERFDAVFHLASTLTLEAEADPDAAFANNIEPLRRLVARSRGARFNFASSIAVFGGELPDEVDDHVKALPTTVYGTHKAVSELLLADAHRRGAVDARILRLPIVLTRPGSPTPAISDRVAAIIREPLAGRRVSCPFAPETRIPVASAGAVASAFVRLDGCGIADLPAGRAMNLPSLTVSVSQMVAAVERRDRGGLVDFRPEAELQSIVDGWPRMFTSEAASALRIAADASIDELISDQVGS
jgi:nucleoside-diphosphate-sugar epimerase